MSNTCSGVLIINSAIRSRKLCILFLQNLVYNASLFANCLTDLSVSDLLILQHSVQHFEENDDLTENRYVKPNGEDCLESENGKCDKPATMALMAEERGYAPSSHTSFDAWAIEEKPSKLQTLFQISITALAFLSFGGYLLCLIVQSIKSKGTTFLHSVASTVAPTNGVKRIKIYRRNRRSSLPPIEATQGYNYNYDNNYNQPVNPYQHYYK